MSVNDLTADMIATIRNGQQAKIAQVDVNYNTLNQNVLNVLKEEGFITNFKVVEVRKGVKKISIDLKYHQGQPVIQIIKKVSKSGLRNFSPIEDLKRSYNGLGVKIISTSKGVLSDHEARKQNVGGEVICEVF